MSTAEILAITTMTDADRAVMADYVTVVKKVNAFTTRMVQTGFATLDSAKAFARTNGRIVRDNMDGTFSVYKAV